MNQLISVIITTKNEERNIENCLKSILDQTYPQENIEIIVVDNNSNDKTAAIVQEFSKRFTPLNVKLFNWGPERSAQRNFGVEKSSGEYFLYLDADMILHKDVIKDCMRKIYPVKSGEAGPPLAEFNRGETTNLRSDETIALYVSEIVMGKRFFSKVRRFERSFYDGTAIDCARFIKKSAFQEVGGFDENLTGPEDWDLDKKLRGVGKIELIKTPIYHNEAEFDLKKYLSKKGYYAKSFGGYVEKWGKDDADLKKQFGLYYRFFRVFIEKGKWKKLLAHPLLMSGMYFLRFLVGIKFLMR